MTESEAIKICNTIGFATSFSNPQGIPLNTTKEELTEAIRMSIQALEKQIPKKPRFYAHNYYCSVCDSLIGNNEFEWKRFKYCDNCGQKLDWSDEE